MAAIARTETIEIDDDNANAPDPFAITTEQIFRSALEDFKSSLTQTQLEDFPGKRIHHVKRKIMSIQQQQERLKAMMNFSRIQFYLERFAEFDSVCQSTKLAGEESGDISAFIWGPSTHILQVSQEDHTVLDVVLDAYQRFGKRIPEIQIYSELIKERPNMMKCIAFMYHDLLQFYQKLVALLTGRGEDIPVLVLIVRVPSILTMILQGGKRDSQPTGKTTRTHSRCSSRASMVMERS